MVVPKRKPPKRRKLTATDDRLVEDLVKFINRYLVLTEAQTLIVALYILHTYIVSSCYQTPYLQISSPEKQCGKSRLLEVLAVLVYEPWGPITTPSAAVLFRMVADKVPTLLWDEIDAVFAPKTAQFHEEHRALLDSGHRRGNFVPRFIGGKVIDFPVFCPKVFAGIGALPDTIADRSIPIRLQRRKATELVSDFIHEEVKAEADEIVERIEEWAEESEDEIGVARPDGMIGLSDRMREGSFSLVAIADQFGCGEEARSALTELLTAVRVDSQETMRLKLLRDIKEVCEQRGTRGAITTDALLEGLWNLPETNWAEGRYYGRDLDDKDLAALLSHYGAKPQLIKFKKIGAKRGYRLDDYQNKNAEDITGLRSSWERYSE